MKSINFSPSLSEQRKAIDNNIINLSQGITKRLLEKYKPKDRCQIAIINNRKNKKRVA